MVPGTGTVITVITVITVSAHVIPKRRKKGELK